MTRELMTTKRAAQLGTSVLGKTQYYTLKLLCQAYVPFWTEPTVIGRANLHTPGPLLILSAHQSNYDYVYIATYARRIRAVLKQELFHKAPRFFAQGGAIPLERTKRDLGALRAGRELLKNQEALLVFAEGTRNPGQHINLDEKRAKGLRTYFSDGVQVVFVGLAGTDSLGRNARPVISVSEPQDAGALRERSDMAAQVISLLKAEQQRAWREYNLPSFAQVLEDTRF